MSKFIETLKEEHKLVLKTLEKVREGNLTNSEKLNTLKGVKDALLGHLKKEDEVLYPFLNKEAENDEKLASELKIYAKEMDKISEFLFNFYEKYESIENLSTIFFKSDLALFMATLKDRILKEEIYLYKEYDVRIKENE